MGQTVGDFIVSRSPNGASSAPYSATVSTASWGMPRRGRAAPDSDAPRGDRGLHRGGPRQVHRHAGRVRGHLGAGGGAPAQRSLRCEEGSRTRGRPRRPAGAHEPRHRLSAGDRPHRTLQGRGRRLRASGRRCATGAPSRRSGPAHRHRPTHGRGHRRAQRCPGSAHGRSPAQPRGGVLRHRLSPAAHRARARGSGRRGRGAERRRKGRDPGRRGLQARGRRAPGPGRHPRRRHRQGDPGQDHDSGRRRLRHRHGRPARHRAQR